jgi:glycosyltransferase involved in cell wall biosynthesis
MFYIKYPYLRWITFRDMHGMTQNDFARNLSECILAIWSDQISTFPLFLVEALKCDVPVVAQMPQLLFDWTTDEVATWAMTDAQIIELVARFIKSWLEDNVPDEFKNLDKLIEGKFTVEEMENEVARVYDEYLTERIDTLTKAIDKLKEKEAADEANKTEIPQIDEKKD